MGHTSSNISNSCSFQRYRLSFQNLYSILVNQTLNHPNNYIKINWFMKFCCFVCWIMNVRILHKFRLMNPLPALHWRTNSSWIPCKSSSQVTITTFSDFPDNQEFKIVLFYLMHGCFKSFIVKTFSVEGYWLTTSNWMGDIT